MRRLKKPYYPLPEAAERSDHTIDDFLWLAERRKVKLSVNAHHWPIVWGDEREFPGAPEIEIENPVKPPFDYYNSGYLNLCWYDIRSLRMHKKLSLGEVYAEKDGREYVGSIQRGTTDFHGRQHECELEFTNIFISHEELQRVINGEVGDWEPRTERTIIDTNVDGRSERKPRTQAVHRSWQEKYIEVKNEHSDKSDTWIAQKISKMPTIAKGRKMATIRKNMKPKKS